MRTPIINNESNRQNTPDGNTDSGKDKRQYQEEYFGTILNSLFERLTNSPDRNPTNDANIWFEIARLLDNQFKKLIWQFTSLPSYYLVSKKQRTGNEDYFIYMLQAEIFNSLQLNIYDVPDNYLVVENEIDGIDISKVISFLKQQKENLNRMESINFTVLVDFLIGVTTNLFILKIYG
jgi:hypothetical protein